MSHQALHDPSEVAEKCSDEADANSYRDFREVQDEVCYGVVEWQGTYYVLAKGTLDWARITGKPD